MANVIVKVQKPLSGNGTLWLLYEEGHAFQRFIPHDEVPGLLRKWMEFSFKGYFLAARRPEGGWDIKRRVPEQNW